MINSHLPAGQLPPTVATFNGGDSAVIAEKTQTRVYINTPVSGLLPSEPTMPIQQVTTQFQERNITSTRPSYSNLNQGMLMPLCNNQRPAVSTQTVVTPSVQAFLSPSTGSIPFKVQQQPNEETSPILTAARMPFSQKSLFPTIGQFVCLNQGTFSPSPQVAGLRPDSQDPLWSSRGFTRADGTPSTPAISPQVIGTSLQSQQFRHFPIHITAQLSQPAQQVFQGQHQPSIMPQSHPLVSGPITRESSTPATHALATGPALDIGNPGTSTANRRVPAKKSPPKKTAAFKAVSNAIIPGLKTNLSRTVRATMPDILREILGKQLKNEVRDSVIAMVPGLREQINQVASSSITAIISEIQKSLTTSLSEATTSSMEGFIQTFTKETLEETRKKMMEQSTEAIQGTLEGALKTLNETISALSALKEQQEKAQATSLQTAEAFKKATDDLKEFVNSQVKIPNPVSVTTPSNYPRFDPPVATETSFVAPHSTSSDKVLEIPDGPPPFKKMRTKESGPAADFEIKRSQAIITKLTDEVSRAMGIRTPHVTECSTGQILLLAARLINGNKELLVQAAKPRIRRSLGNPSHQERVKSEKDRKRRMQCEIDCGFQELENSVREFSKKHLNLILDSDVTRYGIIEEAYSILNAQNNDRLPAKTQRLRNTGKTTSLNEYYKNSMELLEKERREQQEVIGSPVKSETTTV